MIVVEVRSPSNAGASWDAKLLEYWNASSIVQLVVVKPIDAKPHHTALM